MAGIIQTDTKPRLQVALLGANGAGKTTLARALSARPSPRPRRASPAPPGYETPRRRYAVLDWGPEEDLVRGLLAAYGDLAGAVLVASAADGLTPASRRQVRLACELGVPHLFVWIARADEAPPGRVERAEAEARALLHAEGYPGDDAPVLCGDAWSAVCADGKDPASRRPLDDLRAAFDIHLRPPTPAGELPFRMTVEEVTSLKRGLFAAASGRVEQGCVMVGDRVAVVGEAATPRVVGLRMFHRAPHRAGAGDRVTVLLRRALVPRLAPGDVLSRPGAVDVRRRFEGMAFRWAGRRGTRPPPFTAGPVRLTVGGRAATAWLAPVGPAGQWEVGVSARVCVELDGQGLGAYPGLRFALPNGHGGGFGVVVA